MSPKRMCTSIESYDFPSTLNYIFSLCNKRREGNISSCRANHRGPWNADHPPPDAALSADLTICPPSLPRPPLQQNSASQNIQSDWPSRFTSARPLQSEDVVEAEGGGAWAFRQGTSVGATRTKHLCSCGRTQLQQPRR
jgi:hypothetical protein